MIEDLFQPMHLLVIFVIALFVFGPKQLPELGKGIGEGIRGFKSAKTQHRVGWDVFCGPRHWIAGVSSR
jgi:TatA/E family protein of Tat protein translocase